MDREEPTVKHRKWRQKACREPTEVEEFKKKVVDCMKKSTILLGRREPGWKAASTTNNLGRKKTVADVASENWKKNTLEHSRTGTQPDSKLEKDTATPTRTDKRPITAKNT